MMTTRDVATKFFTLMASGHFPEAFGMLADDAPYHIVLLATRRCPAGIMGHRSCLRSWAQASPISRISNPRSRNSSSTASALWR